jgi:hypothetical protein
LFGPYTGVRPSSKFIKKPRIGKSIAFPSSGEPNVKENHTTSWSGDGAVDLYLVRISDGTSAVLIEDIRGFPQSPKNAGRVPRLGHERFLTDPFQFIIY